MTARASRKFSHSIDPKRACIDNALMMIDDRRSGDKRRTLTIFCNSSFLDYAAARTARMRSADMRSPFAT
jgi:hypothetical protein